MAQSRQKMTRTQFKSKWKCFLRLQVSVYLTSDSILSGPWAGWMASAPLAWVDYSSSQNFLGWESICNRSGHPENSVMLVYPSQSASWLCPLTSIIPALNWSCFFMGLHSPGLTSFLVHPTPLICKGSLWPWHPSPQELWWSSVSSGSTSSHPIAPSLVVSLC